jgi:hypothetical protein
VIVVCYSWIYAMHDDDWLDGWADDEAIKKKKRAARLAIPLVILSLFF